MSIDIQEQFTVFMPDLETRLAEIGIPLIKQVIDHAAYRAETGEEYAELKKFFESISKVHTIKHFHEREFCCFVLNTPLTYGEMKIFFVEFSEPGGSDAYATGFQHIEFLTRKSFQEIGLKKEYENLLFSGKFGEEPYLKWEDKIVVKLKREPIIVEALLQDEPKIFVN